MNTARLCVLALAGLTAALPASPTHFVTPAGSATSLCTQVAPCSLPRAVALIGTASLPPGSVVSVAAGVYSQAQLSFKGSGTATALIRFVGEDGARLTGTSVKPTAWTKTAGRTYTWETPSPGFVVGTVAQRPPVSTWKPILIDDRYPPPFTAPSGRAFTLDFPVIYTARGSVALVEAQSCTYTYLASVVYVHLCHDGPPVDADNLYIGPWNQGSVLIDGDYLTLENIAIEQTSGTGLYVHNSANGTVLKHVTARAAQVWLEGTNTLAEDLEVSHVIKQGTFPGAQCYDANPTFGVGECWNAFGDGRALLIGRESKTTSFGQIVRRAFVHRSWNGGRIDGKNTLEDSTFWGFPNHTMEASGTGVTMRRNVFMYGQDSLYMAYNPFDDLTLEHNVFLGAVYVTASSHGIGGVTPTIGWRFRYNILPALVMDRHAVDTVTSDCNVYTPWDKPMQVIDTNGIKGASWPTVAAIKATTRLEQHSRQWARSAWTNGTLFTNFTGPWCTP